MAVEYVPVSGTGAAILTTTSLFTFVAAVAVGLRVWCIRVNRAFRVHDHLICLGLFLSCCHLAVVFTATLMGGLGHHVSEIPGPSTIVLRKTLYTACLTWISATTAVKVSVLVLYLDIFSTHRTFRKVIYGHLVFVAVYLAGYLAYVFTLCVPISHFWTPSGPGICRNFLAPQILTAGVNALFDFAIVITPIPVVMKLQLSWSRKWMIMGLFALGFLICLVSVARLLTTVLPLHADFSRRQVGPIILTSLEVSIGITTACLPTINPLFRRWSSSSSESSRIHYGHHQHQHQHQHHPGHREYKQTSFSSDWTGSSVPSPPTPDNNAGENGSGFFGFYDTVVDVPVDADASASAAKMVKTEKRPSFLSLSSTSSSSSPPAYSSRQCVTRPT